MTVEFKISNFLYPLSILKLKREFDISQYYSLDQFNKYQIQRLSSVLSQSYENIPYYKELFNNLKIQPKDIQSVADLSNLPVLKKSDLKNNFLNLQAKNMNVFKPVLLSTSGTTGEKLSFYVDKPSNILEFVYYWRYWGWAGYTLGDRFVEFSSYYFMKHNPDELFALKKISNRLLLNSIAISENNANDYALIIKKYKPKYLKGLPSVLYYFALFLREQNISGINFKAIFSTGEMLLDYQRKLIEETFKCKVFDSYGHMERTIAASECEKGSLHINPEYGIFEITDKEKSSSDGSSFSGKVIGTSLHNMSMPLIRYELGDRVEFKEGQTCSCGRAMPIIEKVLGRNQDVIVTPDGRVITTMFIIFNEIQGIKLGQIVQNSKDELVLNLVKSEEYTLQTEEILLANARKFVGDEMKISIAYKSLESFNSGKFRTVVSNVN